MGNKAIKDNSFLCRAVPKKKKQAFVPATETNVHGGALCFMVKTWARHKTTEKVLNDGWRLAVGCWRFVVPGGCPEGLPQGIA